MRYKIELILLFGIMIYFFMLIHSLIDLKYYQSKLILTKPIFNEKLVNDKINQFRNVFIIKELKNSENLFMRICESIVVLIMMITFNMLFYFKQTNDIFVDVFKILITFAQYFKYFGEDENKAVLAFLSILSLLFLPMMFPIKTTAISYIILIGVYIITLFFVRTKLFRKKSYINRRNVFIGSLIVFFPYFYLICSIILSSIKTHSRIISQHLNGKPLEVATKFFGRENIYCFKAQQLNMSSCLKFFSKALIILGDWSSFTEQEILGCISHEIGHGKSFESFSILILEYIIAVFLLVLYYEVIKI